MAGFVKRQVKGTGKTLGDWMGLGVSVQVAVWVKNIIMGVFMPWKREARGPSETFEEAMARLGLTEEDVLARKSMFIKQTIFYFLVGLAVIAYGVNLAFQKEVTAMLMSFLVSTIAFANAFRAHFWYFQTKKRKLGCTLHEWLNASWSE